MKTTSKKAIRVSKKQKIIIGIASIIVILCSWWAFVNFMPHPLGDKLEYIGKKDFGGGLFFRDHDSYSEYYYETDISPEKMKTYFKNAEYDGSSRDITSIGTTSNSNGLQFTSQEGNFIITYYDKAGVVAEDLKLPSFNKKYIISISDSDYESIKASL